MTKWMLTGKIPRCLKLLSTNGTQCYITDFFGPLCCLAISYWSKTHFIKQKVELESDLYTIVSRSWIICKKPQTIRRRPIFKSQMVLKILIVVVNNSLRKMQNVFLLGDTYLNILHYSLSRAIIRRKHLRRFVNNIPKSGDIIGPNFT